MLSSSTSISTGATRTLKSRGAGDCRKSSISMIGDRWPRGYEEEARGGANANKLALLDFRSVKLSINAAGFNCMNHYTNIALSS